MPCSEEMGLKVSRHLDDEVTPEERAEIDRHLAECEPCRTFHGIARRNDHLVATALQEAFSPERILAGIEDRLEETAEEADAEEEAAPPAARRGFPWALAAAAAVLVGLVAFAAVQSRRLSDLNDRLADLRDQADRNDDRMRANAEDVHRLAEAYDPIRESEDQRTIRQFLAADHPEATVGYVEPGSVRVYVTTAFLNEDSFERFDVFRRLVGERRFEGPINHEALRRPEFFDESASPGRRYEYRFVGATADGRQVEGLPVAVTYPPAIPEDALQVRLIDVSADGRTARLLVKEAAGSRMLDLAVGASLAFGSRAYTLSEIREGDEVLAITYAETRVDPQGHPIYDPVTGDVKVDLQDRVLSVRQNRQAVFTSDAGSFAVWLHGRTFVRP